MVRGSAVTAEDVALFGEKLKFIGKHGVGVDRLDLKALKTKGVTVMNTPGVNVSILTFPSCQDGV
jgi:D-3-phosphoglycerate dehydrogenase